MLEDVGQVFSEDVSKLYVSDIIVGQKGYSIVRKRHKIKPKESNGDCFVCFSVNLCFMSVCLSLSFFCQFLSVSLSLTFKLSASFFLLSFFSLPIFFNRWHDYRSCINNYQKLQSVPAFSILRHNRITVYLIYKTNGHLMIIYAKFENPWLSIGNCQIGIPYKIFIRTFSFFCVSRWLLKIFRSSS